MKRKTLVTKAELKAEPYKIVKLETYNLSHFLVKIFLVMMLFKIFLFINLRLTH